MSTAMDQVWRDPQVIDRYLTGVRGGIPLVDCFFKLFELALFGGMRPASHQPSAGSNGYLTPGR